MPMESNINEIEEFLNAYVKQKQHLEIHKQVVQIGKPKLKKKFSLGDYIMNNFK